MDQICRTCYKDSFKAQCVFQKTAGAKHSYPPVWEMIEMLTTTKVNKEDQLPKYICSECCTKLMNAYRFKVKCEKVYTHLINNYADLNDDIDASDYLIEGKLDQTEGEKYSDHSQIADEPAVTLNTEKVKREYKCLICLKGFNDKHPMLRHMKTHTKERDYFCEICQKSYKNKVYHKWLHKRNKPHTCHVCGTQFYTELLMKNHLQKHETAREVLQCPFEGCDKLFKTKNGLKYHETTSHDGKQFLCQFCSKSFKALCNLQLHMSYHNKGKEFKCRSCEKEFRNTKQRNQHEKRMHALLTNPRRKYQCNYCKKEFTAKAHKQRHIAAQHKHLSLDAVT